MPATRRRPEAEFEATGAQAGQQIETLQSLVGGYNGYSTPEILSPQFWAPGTFNVYSGQHQTVRRARFAPLVNSSTSGFTPTTVRMESLYGAYFPQQNPWLFFDTNGVIWWLNGLTGTPVATALGQSLSLFYLPAWNLTGPFMRLGMGGAMVFQTNGHARSKIFVNQSTNQPNLELDGIDAPDASPAVLVTAGNTGLAIVSITRTSGVVTITAASATTQFPIGSFITVAGVELANTGILDVAYNSATGTAFQVTGQSGSTLTYSQIGPDDSTSTIANTGTVYIGIVTTVGRSYQFAWENANTGHVSAPSPATQYTLYGNQFALTSVTVSGPLATYNGTFPLGGSNFYANNAMVITGFSHAGNNGTFHISASTTTTLVTDNGSQQANETIAALATIPTTGFIDCLEPGTITVTNGSTAIVGANTFFSQAWVGRSLYATNNTQTSGGAIGTIASVTDATHLTLAANASVASPGSGYTFQVYDQQSTHIRLYATGDGGATYLRIARNAFTPASANLGTAGILFNDNSNAEPPNAPFTNELAQTNNVPPPIATFQDQYQGRRIIYGVPGAPQSFFYSNIESTVVGQPPESFAPLNEVTLPIGDGQLFGTANLPTGFIFWSNRQDMFKLTGTLTDNTVANAQQLGASIQRLPYKIGCGSPYATCVTNLGAFWLSSDREVWLFTDNYAPKNVGRPVQDILNSINGTRLAFARMTTYKSGDRNWVVLAVATGTSTFNNQMLALDLDLLASNGQASFFTFDMATNQPSWYPYSVNCEAITSAFDANSVNHLLAGDVDVITDLDWNPNYYTVGTEQSVPNSHILHAVGNQAPEMIKTGKWMRVTTNQLPKVLASQGWNWNILSYDDDSYIIGINPLTTKLVPGANSSNRVMPLETSPALFKFGSTNFIKGRRFQIQTNFPTAPGFYELRSFQFAYDQIVAR